MYDPDFPTDLDVNGLDFEGQDLLDAARTREAHAAVALADLQDDDETPVQGGLFDLLFAEGSTR